LKAETEHLNQVLDANVASRVAPSICAAVGTLESDSPLYIYPHNQNTIFDLASLTKILATTVVAAEAIVAGKLTLEEQPFKQWPGVRVVDILQHTSGLPAWKSLYERPNNKATVVARALAVTLEAPPRSRMVYSDIGFIALGHLLESRLAKSLDEVFSQLAQKHYVAPTLSYRRHVDSHISHIAPTGICPVRRRRLRGEVNDLNVFALGGVAGHAGLFGSLHDIIKAARFFLKCFKHPTSEFEKTLQHFMKADGARAIGFDRADRRGTTDGVLSEFAIGHLGFTGTSLWIDPEAAGGKGAYFILLTNHTETSSRKRDLLQLRRDFHRAAVRLLS
jgi:CubicO group peptidase (beta-lactamase class C family)